MKAPENNGTLEAIALRAEWANAEKPAIADGYAMGSGTTRAIAPVPWGADLKQDCSAFADWCAGIDKKGPASPVWQNTDALVNDGLHTLKQDLWRLFDAPVRGCLLVYGGHRDAHGRHPGHVGVCVSATETIDSSSTGKGIGRGVHSVAWFLARGAICIAPNGVA